jgi:hypothetical protein
MGKPKPGRAFLWRFIPCLAVSLACLAYPIYVIRPFRAQGVRELLVALTVMRYRPAVMAACAVCALAALVWYWIGEGRWLRRVASAAGVLAVLAVALLSRINIYELIFHPLDNPTFAPAAQTKLDGAEKVIAVGQGPSARAYPIRIMAYHHVVNDMLDGVPIAATY